MKLPTDVLLVCWRESAGARLEWAYAEKIGKEIVMAEQGWIEEYLERVEIGQNSFTKYPYNTADGRDDNRHFYLKNCSRLKSLKIGFKSFMDYSVCEIENVDALEVIEMSDLNEWSSNFHYASLELKSILIHSE